MCKQFSRNANILLDAQTFSQIHEHIPRCTNFFPDARIFFMTFFLQCKHFLFCCFYIVVICYRIINNVLKVLTNEKRGVMKVATFDRSPCKLFSLTFSAKSVQTLSCERLKTTQRTLFLSFEIKNCFPITVLRRSFMKKSGKLACHVVN